jgi:hypothetical protein
VLHANRRDRIAAAGALVAHGRVGREGRDLALLPINLPPVTFLGWVAMGLWGGITDHGLRGLFGPQAMCRF